MFEDVFGEDADAMRATIGANLPAGRIGDPAELAAAVVFLASSHGSFVYGSNLVVDGGEL
jgi:NAD(P)-dependent dehydrogenase (short-subunit alcohol dehydrogenase family)